MRSTLLALIISILLSSCSSYKKYEHIENKNQNAFLRYSLIRLTPKQLNQLEGKNQQLQKMLYQCYQDKDITPLIKLSQGKTALAQTYMTLLQSLIATKNKASTTFLVTIFALL